LTELPEGGFFIPNFAPGKAQKEPAAADATRDNKAKRKEGQT
jgi:hypothetical protein